jgi:hypothetical protein
MSELHALLVGIDRYDPQRVPGSGLIPDLQGSVHDIQRMEEFLLQAPLAVPASRIRKLVSPGLHSGIEQPPPEELPSYRNLIRELEALIERARKGDRVLIHYSGHGASLPTVVPDKKGKTGRDECLVPCNAAVPRGEGGGFLRDVELNALLGSLADHGLQVTLILDCCHSGGITRDLGRGRSRGLGDLAVLSEAPGPLGSWEDLGALLPQQREESELERFRNLFAQPGWFPQPEGCVLLAACLPTELAREYPFEDGRWSGALTHFFLQAAGDLGPRPTYRWLHHRLLGRIRGLFDSQTPVLNGDGDLAVLGQKRWPAERGIAILEVVGEGERKRVLLGAGMAQGLGDGALLAVRPGDGDDGSPAGTDARLEVEEAGATSAWARISEQAASDGVVVPGELVALVDPGPAANRYRVGILSRAGADEEHRQALRRLQREVAAGSRLLLVSGDGGVGKAEFQVEVLPGGVFQILDGSGEALPHQGEAIPVRDTDGVGRVLDRVEQLAHFREVENLVNPDSSSPLFGRIRTELFALKKMTDWQKPEARVAVGAAQVPTGTLLCLLVENDSGLEVKLAVLDLQPDWGIQRVYPNRRNEAFSTLAPGASCPVFLKAGLPDWMNHGRDRLKIFAATGPLDTSHLEREALGQSTGYRSLRIDQPRNLRAQLFRSATSGSFRNTEALTPVSHEWVVEAVELGVVKEIRPASNLLARPGQEPLSCPAPG